MVLDFLNEMEKISASAGVNELRECLSRMQRAIETYERACEDDAWKPHLDAKIWKSLLGEKAPEFPWEHVPSRVSLHEGCMKFQAQHHSTPIYLPPVTWSDDAPSEEEERAMLRAKIEYLKDAARHFAAMRGQDLCWENTAELCQARRVTMGVGEPQIQRPEFSTCTRKCVRFADQLYGTFELRLKKVLLPKDI